MKATTHQMLAQITSECEAIVLGMEGFSAHPQLQESVSLLARMLKVAAEILAEHIELPKEDN